MMKVPTDILMVVNGVAGSFLIHGDRTTLSDVGSNLDSVSRDIVWLKRLVQEKHSVYRMYVHGQRKDVILYLDEEFTMGVMVSKDTNIHLLHRVVNKLLSTLKTPQEESLSAGERFKEAKEFFDSL